MIRVRRKDNRATTHLVRDYDPNRLLFITLCGRLLYTSDYERQSERLGICDACARIASKRTIKGPQ